MEQLKEMCTCYYVHLDEGLVAQILSHLPAKSVLRFRAVCKDWLRITACPSFLAAHARRSPLEVLLYSTRTTVGSVDLQEIDAVDVSADRPSLRRHLARYPVKAQLPRRCESRQYCSLLASCHGLLLFLNGGLADSGPPQYLVCNPVTRRWSDLPRLRLSRYVRGPEFKQRGSGFYFHEPSREYRLLCHLTFMVRGLTTCYCILSTGAAGEPRRLSVQATPVDEKAPDLHLVYKNLMTPAVLHGHLHWLKHMEGGLTDQMVAFDTVAETFRRMPPPPVTCREHSNLLVADGSLMASELGHLFVDLWVLDGYAGADVTGDERWVPRHRIEVPWQDDRLLLAAGGDGGDFIMGTNRGVLAYNVRSGMVRQVVGVDASTDDTIFLSRRVFRGSLVLHGFFDARPHPGLPLFRFCA